MENKEIAYRRLRTQHITGAKENTAAEVVQRLGAVQAQDYAQALWAIGSRMHNADVTAVEQAIANREIVLTWPMRGTLHFVPAADIRWMLRLLASRIYSRLRGKLEQQELKFKQMMLAEKIILDALREHKQMRRVDLMKLLEYEGIATANGQGYNVLLYLAHSGLICMGPLEGKQQTFVLLDDWLPKVRDWSMEESLKELATRYFTGHGPATVYDFVWWSGLPIREARKGLEAARTNLLLERQGGTEYWMGAEPSTASIPDSAVHLLAGYDEYLLGYKERSAIVKKEYAPLISGKNAVFAPMLVIDGEIVGLWKRKIRKEKVDISVHPFTTLKSGQQEIIEAAQRYSEFMNMTLSRIDIDNV
ncbi:winged helix DNA-binding domain-containing protein [Paenibacillus shenyangensis]|uniref:winged helix DNA-binding domain-containing protein n=1 Tax=Paenibacillus sp. A9 TaxID=1284352 RepID=UPI00036D596C|nr:winged helix DNA-binding domain-containing protein [Paenibacillus sp. A9]